MKNIVVVVVVVVVAVVVAVRGKVTAITTTTTTAATPVIKTVPPPPSQDELRLSPKDCPLYLFGILQTIRKHGETWINDANGCELCECVQGLKRCYYHYCNQGTEIVTNPPLSLPPWDDEDRGGEEEWEEGSGKPPPPYYYKGYPKSPDVRARTRANETPMPEFCDGKCRKKCVFGYEINHKYGCSECVCRAGNGNTCSRNACRLPCKNGYKKDRNGCDVCVCRNERKDCPETIEGCMDRDGVRRTVGEEWSRGPCVKCSCVLSGYTECNVTQCGGGGDDALLLLLPPCPRHYSKPATECCSSCRFDTHTSTIPEVSSSSSSDGNGGDVSVMSPWERDDPPYHTSPPGAPRDGAVRSAVQAEVLTWWQLLLIMVCVAGVVAAVVCVSLKHYRHRDKYDINNSVYPIPHHRVRHVATPEHVKGGLM